MATLWEHLCSLSPESNGISELVLSPVLLSVPEANALSSTPGSPITNTNTTDIDDNEPGLPPKDLEKLKKKHCAADHQSTRSEGISMMMKEDSAHCEKHKRHIQSALDDFVKETKRGQLNTNNILQQILDLKCSHTQAL
jgi:hypothetical protein